MASEQEMICLKTKLKEHQTQNIKHERSQRETARLKSVINTQQHQVIITSTVIIIIIIIMIIIHVHCMVCVDLLSVIHVGTCTCNLSIYHVLHDVLHVHQGP